MTSEIRANTLKNRVGLGTVSFTNTGPVVSGIVTANSFSGPLITTSIDLNGDLDVDGHTNLDNVSIAGVTTGTTINATTFVGALTGTASGNPTLTSGANDRIITATGANTIQGESTLTYGTSGQLKITRAAQSNVGLYVFHSDGNEVGHFGNIGSGNEGILALKDGGTDTVILNGETGGKSYINSGKVGIGTNNPTNKVEVYGTDAVVTLLNYGQSSGGLAAWTSGRLAFASAHQNDDLVFGYSNSTLSVANFVEHMRIDNGTGNVGIGTGVPDYLMTLAGISGTTKLNLKRTNASANGNAYGSIFYTTETGADVASIRAHRESANTDAYLAFSTKTTSGTLDERFRINSGGNLQLGSSADAGNALRYLDIGNYNTGGSAGSILRLLTRKSDGSSSTSADIVKYKAGGLVINNNEAIGTSGYISFGTATGGGSTTERMRIQSTGIVKVETNDSSSFNAHFLVNNSESNSGISLIGSGSSFSAGGWAAVTDAGIIRSSANSSNGLVLQAASGDLRFYAGGNPPAERFRLANDGTPTFYSPAVAWHEGPAVLEASNGFAEIFFRSTGSTHGTSVTGSWSIGKLDGSNGFGILKNGMTGSGAGRADAALTISDAGDITIGKKMLLPNTVAFSARGGPNDLTNAAIVFGTSVFQRGGTNYSTSTGVFTAPVAGIYHFMCNPYRYSDSADSYITLQKSTNSGASWNSEIEIRIMTTGATGWATLGLSQIIDLNANDQVRMYATNRIHCNGVFSRFSGFLVA